MNTTTTTTTLAAIAIVSALALVIAPSLMATASAAPNTACVNPGGNAPKGQTQEDTPPGKASCPNEQFTKKNERAVK